MTTATVNPVERLASVEVQCDIDDAQRVTLYRGTIRHILEELELYTDYRDTWNEDEPGVRRSFPYRDSHFWWRQPARDINGNRNSALSGVREARGIRIGVNVGCSCSHDCCGHACSLYYTIVPVCDGVYAVTSSRSFNV